MNTGNFRGNFKTRRESLHKRNRNLELKNKHVGKRCFILGNEKSLMNLEVRHLKDEIVFVTNNFFDFECYDEIEPDYYLLFERFYFDKKNIKACRILKKKFDNLRNKKKKPVFIVPLLGKKMVEEFYGWEEWTQVYYADNSLNVANSCIRNYNMIKKVIKTNAVIEDAILIASYMGIQEINLVEVGRMDLLDELMLYCGTSFKQYILWREKKPVEYYIRKIKRKDSLEKRFDYCIKVFQDLKKISQYCASKGIILQDCSLQPVVTCIPHVRYTSLF